MNILCATDDNYTPYCGIMLTSLLENNKDEKISIYILTDGLSADNKNALHSLEQKYDCSITIICVDADMFKDCPINPETDHVSLAAYYRLALTSLLPQAIHKILYLDCDIIINSSIKDLYHTYIDNFACGVVKDEAYMWDVHYDRLGLPKDHTKPYFNSGVLLINMDYWRENDVQGQCMACIAENKEKLAFHDQDTLNIVLRENVKYLSTFYNMQTGFILTHIYNACDKKCQNDINQSVKLGPGIIHFTGACKPWQVNNRNPYKSIWLKYRSMSHWQNIPLERTGFNIKDSLMRFRNEIIWHLGIKQRPQFYII